MRYLIMLLFVLEESHRAKQSPLHCTGGAEVRRGGAFRSGLPEEQPKS